MEENLKGCSDGEPAPNPQLSNLAGSEPEESSILNTPRNKKGRTLGADAQGMKLAADGQYQMQMKRKFAEVEEANEDFKHIRAELEEAHEDLKRKSAELEDFKRTNAELQETNGDLKLKIAELVEANGELKRKNAELEEANGDLKLKIVDHEEANGGSEAYNNLEKHPEDEKQRERDRKDTLANECVDSFIPLATNKDWYEKEIRRLEAKNDSLENDNQLLNLEKRVFLEHKWLDVLENKMQDNKVLLCGDQYEGLEETQLLEKQNSALMERIKNCEAKNLQLEMEIRVLLEQLRAYKADKNGQQGEPCSE